MKTATPKPKHAALNASRFDAFLMDPAFLVIVGLDKYGPEDPLYDERCKLPVDEALARNIMVYGILKNVLVTKRGEDVVVVDGRQRVLAARQANTWLVKEGKEPVRVPVVVKRGEEHRLYGVLVSANGHGHADSVLALARKLARYLDMGRSDEEAAVAFGRSMPTIESWKQLLELESEVQAAIEAGQLSASAALERCYGKSREAQLRVLGGKLPRARGRQPGVTRSTLRKLVREAEGCAENAGLHEEFLRGVRFALGELSADQAGVGHLLHVRGKKGTP